MAYRYPDRVAVRIGFIPALAHRIYAGSDMLLMPSMRRAMRTFPDGGS